MSDSQPVKPKQKKRVTYAVNERGIRIGEDHHNALLTNEQIDRIRDLREDHGLSYKQLSLMFQVSFQTIASVCQYRRRAQTPFGWKTLVVDVDE
jgi:ribosome-binding protein aMBF1 (putative translation factor)